MKKCALPGLIGDWIECINRGDADRLVQFMSPGHTFYVDGEQPTVGPTRNLEAWRGYFAAFPHYLIFVDDVYEDNGTYYVLGHTQGSHVPAELESIPRSVIWKVGLDVATISEWIIYDGSKRADLGLPDYV